MRGDETDKLRLPNNPLVRAQQPGIPLQVLGVFSLKSFFDGHCLKRFVLKCHVVIIFRHHADQVQKQTRGNVLSSPRRNEETKIACFRLAVTATGYESMIGSTLA